MSRARRAGIAASFGYLNFALALISGIALVPFILSRVGTEQYGVWLAFVELIAYSSMVDLGVVGIVPWLLAESDGAKDRATMRSVLTGAIVFASAAAAVFATLALLLLWLAPGVVGLTPEQRAALTGPGYVVIIGMAVGMPLRAFYAAVIGLQDVTFAGKLSLAQLGLGIVATVVGLLAGWGLYALAAALALPAMQAGIVGFLRLRVIAPDLLTGWRLPSWPLLRMMTTQGLGSWTAGLGWRMVAASDSMVVLAVAGPEAAVVYAMTLKLGAVAMQMSWQLPDAGLVGLAQLKGEGRPERVREVTEALIRVVMLGAGAVACAVLAFNPSFVTLWVGAPHFGGLTLNALLACVILAHSLAHGLFTTSATLGTRVQAGWASLLQGGANLAAALLLGRLFGLPGVAAAAVLTGALVAYPAGVWMVHRTTGMTQRDLWAHALGPWAVRAAPLMLLGALVGALGLRVSLWLPFFLAPLLVAAYVWTMRPLYRGMPFPARVRPWLLRLGLVTE